jgi:hypothetical protein
VTTSTGGHYDSRDQYVSEMATRWTADPSIAYVRTPTTVEVHPNGKRAAESGTWVGTSTEGGPSRFGGPYLAHWVKTDAGWQMIAELFVQLHCSGPFCAK